MKRTAFAVASAAVLILPLLLALGGCSSRSGEVDIESSVIGIMETRGTEKTSRIIFYDENLDETGYLDLPYATFGGIFYNPLISQGSLYAIPQGEHDKKDGNMAVRIDLSALAVEEYRIDQPAMNAIATNNEYIWTCNTFNRESFINRCSMESGDVLSVAVPEEFVMNILWKDDTLYAFSKSMETSDVSVSLYDMDLNFMERIDIADENLSVYRTAVHEDLIYFCGMGADEAAGYEGKIGVLDTRDKTVDYVNLNERYPSSIAFHGNTLLVSHYDPFQGSETDSPFSIIDLETGSVKHYELGHPVEQIAVAGDTLFVLSGGTVFRYQIDGMQLVDSAEIKMMPGDFSYISGMFVMPQP